MQLANMFKKGINLGKNEGSGKRMTSPEVPEGILKKCNACKAAIFTEDVKKGYYICPKCGNEVEVFTTRGRIIEDTACPCGYVFKAEEPAITVPKEQDK